MSTEERVKKIIEEHLGVKPEQITLSSKIMEDLGGDSIDAVDLIMAVEDEFNIEIPDKKAEKLKTVGQIINHIVTNTGGDAIDVKEP